MIANKLIECAKALALQYPDKANSIDDLIGCVERIDSEFDGEQRIELLVEASQALERHMERARATAETKRLLADLRKTHATLEGAMRRLAEVAKASVVAKNTRELAADWPTTSLPKKVTWH
jgi:hypothetical protein